MATCQPGEVFDEEDLQAALAKFDQLSRPAPRLENAASQAAERYSAHFAARDWDALAKVLADDIVTDDRRRVANAGIRHGRDADIANMQATADAGFTYMASVVIAARGEHLILARTRVSGGDRGSGEFIADMLGVVEINSTIRSRRSSCSSSTTSTPPSPSSTRDTSPAKRPPMRARGRSSRRLRYATMNRHENPPTTLELGEYRPPPRDGFRAR